MKNYTWSLSPIFIFIWIGILIDRISAGNYTIDDAASAITYSTGWNVGNDCTGCFAQPDKTKAHGGTWHDTTRGSGGSAIYFEYSFQGTDVYIYGIIADIVTTTYVFTTNNDLTLSIDNNLVATFKHDPQNLNSYSYNQPIFAIHGLSASSHTVRVDLQPSSLFIFDYLIYTTPDLTPSPNSPSSTSTSSSPSSSSSSSTSSPSSSSTTSRSSSSRPASLSIVGLLSFTNEPDVVASIASSHQDGSGSDTTPNSKKLSTGALIGIILGSIGLLLLLGFLIYLLCTRRRRQQQRLQEAAVYQSPTQQSFAVGPEGPVTGHNGGSVTFPQTFNDISMTNISHPYSAGSMPLNETTSPLNPNEAMIQEALWTMPSPNVVVIDSSGLNSKQRMMQQHHQVFAPAHWQASQATDHIPMWVTSASNRVPSLISGDNTSSSGYSRAYGGERVSEVESTYPYNLGVMLQQRSDGQSLTSGYPESVTSDERVSPRVAFRSIRIGTAEAKNINIDRGVIMPRSSSEKDPNLFSNTQNYQAAVNARTGGLRSMEDTEAEEELSSVIGRGIATSDDDYDGDNGHVISRPPTAPPPYMRSPPPPPHESIPAVPAIPSNLRSNRI